MLVSQSELVLPRADCYSESTPPACPFCMELVPFPLYHVVTQPREPSFKAEEMRLSNLGPSASEQNRPLFFINSNLQGFFVIETENELIHTCPVNIAVLSPVVSSSSVAYLFKSRVVTLKILIVVIFLSYNKIFLGFIGKI